MADDPSGGAPEDTMRERVPESWWRVWLVLDADRRAVTGMLLVGVFLALVAAGAAHPTPARTLLSRGDPIETLFQALVAATITGVTLVLTLSQLVLSQELGAVGDQRERMEESLSFRRDVEGVTDAAVSPAEPSAFLRALVRATETRATALAAAVDGNGDRDANGDATLAERVDAYVDDVVGNADAVTDQLEGATFGEFDVVWAALNYNYSWKIYAGRRIRTDHADELSDEADEALGALLDVLELFGPAREHFKTLYFQWELSQLSRTLLYAALPALTVAIGALLLLDPRALPGATLGVSHTLLVVALAVTVALVPFAVLLAYVLRIVSVTKRTLAIGPFILRETDRSVDLDRE
ncbi:MAG: hypothetical protein ABEH78_00400 [Haloferacaceae archaeon]